MEHLLKHLISRNDHVGVHRLLVECETIPSREPKKDVIQYDVQTPPTKPIDYFRNVNITTREGVSIFNDLILYGFEPGREIVEDILYSKDPYSFNCMLIMVLHGVKFDYKLKDCWTKHFLDTVLSDEYAMRPGGRLAKAFEKDFMTNFEKLH